MNATTLIVLGAAAAVVFVVTRPAPAYSAPAAGGSTGANVWDVILGAGKAAGSLWSSHQESRAAAEARTAAELSAISAMGQR